MTTYARIKARGSYLRIIHTTDGIRTHCGRRLSGFQAQVDLTTTKPDGRICRQCEMAQREAA